MPNVEGFKWFTIQQNGKKKEEENNTVVVLLSVTSIAISLDPHRLL